MSVTIDEIVAHQDRLRREIMERECLLAAFNVLHGYVASGRAPQSVELSSLVSALAPSAPMLIEAKPAEPPPPALPTPTPTPLPAAPAPKPYMHPELERIGRRHGSDTEAVGWAIERMLEDYSLRDIHTLLRREGYSITGAQISVVLTRMRSRDQIEEVKGSYGPRAAVYRKPENPILMGEAAADRAECSAAA